MVKELMAKGSNQRHAAHAGSGESGVRVAQADQTVRSREAVTIGEACEGEIRAAERSRR